ncbi:uncharacterized protein LOC119272310 [Triticum dicoccoides]|uniref:uncharacterized protein LOC119272310 n=1 Tax=Triticum dicoccoides TaxID=85692 RepID=UPI00188FCDA4|nr:uncharacterized protein LOC119272310 [Triticum dicoccoides]
MADKSTSILSRGAVAGIHGAPARCQASRGSPCWLRAPPAASLPSGTLAPKISPPPLVLLLCSSSTSSRQRAIAAVAATVVTYAREDIQEVQRGRLHPSRASTRAEPPHTLDIELIFAACIAGRHHRLPRLRSTQTVPERANGLVTSRLLPMPP